MREAPSPDRPEAVWKERDMSGGAPVDAMVAILRTDGCAWAKKGGCSMCGYGRASVRGVTEGDLSAQIGEVLSRYAGEPFVKIYTSGSFLDEAEIPLAVRERIFSEFAGCERLLFESRPEFVTAEAVASLPRNATVAFGLESSDPEVLERSIGKGFGPGDCRRAALAVKGAGLSVRTYVMLKPPFMTESRAIEDAVSSAAFADEFSDEISVNPLNVQRATRAERLWSQGELRPPWIWSLIEAMRRMSGTVRARVMSSPSGGGSARGAHNCGACDAAALAAVERFSFTQDPRDLDAPAPCGCRAAWESYMRAESLLGTPSDLDRGMFNDLMMRM
ncbi:MAG: archaeosine biosynthesis radical SAM protein RaSEA [Candidatus Methanoplasma sp.]|jgi:radical SAM enzyme (TIGR01210 family)|nr:archaeosine biosynthesis radical SAM protein RaSEA [Candidatus Methanoplasma sp.]